MIGMMNSHRIVSRPRTRYWMSLRAMNQAAATVYEALRTKGTQQEVVNLMQTRAELYDVLGYLACEQKLDEFYGVKQVGDDVIFRAKFSGAKKVLIAGDFNNWTPISTPMQPSDRPGEWKMRLPLGKGRYRYRLVVDGKWITDPKMFHTNAQLFDQVVRDVLLHKQARTGTANLTLIEPDGIDNSFNYTV